MLQSDRDRLVASLMMGVPSHWCGFTELLKITTEDVLAIEPVIDDMLLQSQMRGRLQAILEMIAREEKKNGASVPVTQNSDTTPT
jgi:hypothetical protein